MIEKDGVTGIRLERYWTFKATREMPSEAPEPKEVVGMFVRLMSAGERPAPGKA